MQTDGTLKPSNELTTWIKTSHYFLALLSVKQWLMILQALPIYNVCASPTGLVGNANICFSMPEPGFACA